MRYLLWDQGDKAAFQLLKRLKREARYPWASRKLRAAALGLLRRLPTVEDLDWTGQDIVINQEVFE